MKTDSDTAEVLYQRAVSLHSTRPEPFVQYAVFALIERDDYPKAEALYRKALEIKPDDPFTIIRYANLATYVGDIEVAGQLMERAYAIDDTSLAALGAYAGFFWRHQCDLDRAQQLFDQAKDATPRNAWERRWHAAIQLDYARFLALERGEPDEGWSLINEAAKEYPDDVSVAAEHAVYLGVRLARTDDALGMIDEAIALEGDRSVLLGAKATLMLQGRHDAKEAILLYRRALALDPKAAGFKANLAGALFAEGDAESALPLCLQVIRQMGRSDPSLAVECFFYLFANGPAEERAQALTMLKWMLTECARSKDWDLSANVGRATEEQHPSVDWLARLASVIAGTESTEALDAWTEWAEIDLADLQLRHVARV